ncbi:MAG: energy-coupling factor ABC transporter ATP-binding protein [Chloroflexota bacterium]
MTEISLDGVGYRYPDGTEALVAIDLDIQAGTSLALIGANGSGKTTLARHLNGLLRPCRGQVLLDGADAAASTVAQLARQVGLCFQQPDRQIFGHDVRSEVEFGARRLGASGEEAFARAREALATVGLALDIDRHPGDLGETRRKLLTIASVLAMQTPVVVLDEPTTGLDARGIELVQGIIADLHRDGRTVIGISHDMRFVAESFEWIVLMDAGRVMLDGTPASVFGEDAWPTLRAASLEPPYAALLGARLGLGSTPTEASVIDALR